VAVRIDEDTGLLASSDCEHTIEESYLAGSEPQQSCSLMAHEWFLNLQKGPASLSSATPEEIGSESKIAPLIPPTKQPNVFKRFFSKIF
jgi:hypothetical protein